MTLSLGQGQWPWKCLFHHFCRYLEVFHQNWFKWHRLWHSWAILSIFWSKTSKIKIFIQKFHIFIIFDWTSWNLEYKCTDLLSLKEWVTLTLWEFFCGESYLLTWDNRNLVSIDFYFVLVDFLKYSFTFNLYRVLQYILKIYGM